MSAKQTLLQTIEGTDMFSVFARLLKTTGIDGLISAGGPYTVFVPTNDGFGKVPDKVMEAWLSEKGHSTLKNVLSYHIVATRLMAANIGGSIIAAETMSGSKIKFADRSGLKVNDAGIQARNVEASNGIIHALDTVLTPPLVPDELSKSNQKSVQTHSESRVPSTGSSTTIVP